MATAYPIETLTAITNDFYCDCSPACLKRIILPPETFKMLMEDVTLILIIDGCESDRAGAVVAEGKFIKGKDEAAEEIGWKVYRVE